MIDRNPLGVQSVKSDIHQFSPDGDKGTVVYMCYCNLQNSTLLDEGNFAIGLLLRNSYLLHHISPLIGGIYGVSTQLIHFSCIGNIASR